MTGNSGFSILAKDTSACRWGRLGIKLLTFRSNSLRGHDSLTLLSSTICDSCLSSLLYPPVCSPSMQGVGKVAFCPSTSVNGTITPHLSHHEATCALTPSAANTFFAMTGGMERKERDMTVSESSEKKAGTSDRPGRALVEVLSRENGCDFWGVRAFINLRRASLLEVWSWDDAGFKPIECQSRIPLVRTSSKSAARRQPRRTAGGGPPRERRVPPAGAVAEVIREKGPTRVQSRRRRPLYPVPSNGPPSAPAGDTTPRSKRKKAPRTTDAVTHSGIGPPPQKKRRDVPHAGSPEAWRGGRLLPQPRHVIYKRFNISCPLEVFGNFSVNTSLPDDTCTAKFFTINHETTYTIPILAFAFVCHPEVLPIYTELSNPTKRRMQNIGNVSILGMFIMYFLTAIFGYLTFYENTEAELLHTYSKVDLLDSLILCVRLAVLVAVTLTVPVVLFPIRRALLQILFPGKPFHWLRHIAIAVCLLFSVNLLVIFVPNIRYIFGIIGATTAPSLIFILPGLFYIRIIPSDQEPMNSRPKIQASCFTALGFIFMTMSLTFIGIDWLIGENRSHGGH
ncbi:unnamed protein product [Pleuronectes platessa]|uniref:Amino acid transporter transmembrane domain-containing protein n=1 Tax=Pleuronectes platessa TaxID=8262 RepID=A0A9N7V266_PLEPL|nr:unnamed protein product [Pleuronectes platessa]